MAFSYRQVKDLYDQLRSAGATSVSLPEWSDQMNQLTGTDLYGEGRRDNLLKRASVGIDRALEWTGLPGVTRSLGERAGQLVGNPQAGADIGEGLPRTAVNMLPFLIPGAGWGAAAARLGGAAALAGSEAYTRTGSPASGVVSGVLNAALPKVADLAEQAVLRRMGVQALSGPITRELGMENGNITKLVTEASSRLYPETAGQRLASFAGGQLGAAGLMEGQRWGEEGFSGQPLHNPFSTENLLNYTLGQLPFLGVHGLSKLAGAREPRAAHAEAIARTEERLEQKRAQDALAQQSDIEKIPVVAPTMTPEQIGALVTRRNELRKKQAELLAKPAPTPEDAQALIDAVDADNATPFIPTPTSALGAEQSDEHVQVIGTQIHESKNGKWRKILVADDAENPEELRGKVVEYSRGLREPAPKQIGNTGFTAFGVTADPLWRTVKTVEEEAARQAKYAERRGARPAGEPGATPDLPEQSSPAVDYFGHITDLDKIEVDVDAARTPVELQRALLDFRRLQESTGREPFNDQQLLRVQQKIAEKQPKIDPVKAALKREAARMRRQMDAEEKARTENLARQAVREDTASVTIGENVGQKNQTPMVAIPKLDDASQAIHDFVDEVTSGVQAEKDATQSFEQWRKTTTTKDVTSLPLEKERFKIYLRMKMSGEVGNEENLSESDARTFNDELKAEGIGLDDPNVLRDFPERDHVLNWNDAVTERLVEGKAHAPVAQQIMPQSGNLRQGTTGYENVSDQLLGFPREGPTKAFEEHKYPFTLNLEISTDEGKTWTADAVKGMNRNNAIERARRNWDSGVLLREVSSEALLGDPARAPRLPEPKRYTSDVASQQEEISKLTTDGNGLVRELLADSDPEVRAIATDLATRFPEALARIDSGVYEVPGAYAARRSSGRVGIFFDRSVPSMWGGAKNSIVLHELIHGLTMHELANPKVDPVIISELTVLRERLVESLPPKLREAYDATITSDWYARFAAGKADMNELHPNPNFRQVLYGLLNNDELAAQGFTSRSMREYMQSVGGKKQNGWNKFTNWVKGLLGLKEQIRGTAFGDFLSTTSQLMTHGEWLADFANYGERYFEDQGKGGSYGRAQTDRALGIVAGSGFGLDEPLTIARSLDLSASKQTANAELRRAKRGYEKMLSESEDDKIHVGNVLAELGHKDIDELVTSAIGEGDDIARALDLLPPEATSYVYAKLRDAHDVLDVIRAASSEKNKGMTNIADPKLLRNSVAPVLRNIKKALAHEEFAQQMATDLVGLSSVAPEGLMDALPRMAPKAFEDFIEGGKDVGGKSFQALAKFLEPVGQWARRVPEVAEAISKGFQLQANARKMFHESVKWLGMDTSNPYVDVLTHESTQQTEKVLANPKLNDSVSKWMFWNNKKGNDAVAMLPENDPEIAKLLVSLSDSERASVRDVVAKAGKVTQMLNAQKLEKMNQIAVTHGAGVAALTTGLKTRDNVALADATLKGIQLMADPMTSNEGLLALQGVQQRMQPEAFTELYDFLKGEGDKIKLWKAYFDANPFWATAQRTERYLIKAFNKQNKLVTLQASTTKEANDILAKKGYKLKEIEDQWKGREDEPFAFPNMSPEMAKRMQEIEANQMSMLAKTLSPEDLEQVRQTSPVTQILREATAQQSLGQAQAPPRLLSQGADELPWMWNHISWAQKESNYWSRQLLRAQARTYLKDVEVRSLPDEEQRRLKTHFDNLLMPDPKIAQKITRLNSTWFLGFNLATSIINVAQPFVTHVSELTALTGKPIDSYRRVLSALDEVGGKFVGKRDWASPEHEKLMGEAVKDGEVGIGMFDDEAAAQEAISTNFKRAMKKEAPTTLGQKLGTVAGAYSTAGMWLFQHGERVNSRAALLAGFDYYRELRDSDGNQLYNFQQAKEKAYEFNHAVNFGGGRAQRAVGAYSSRSPFLRGAAMLGTSLQSYVLGTTFQIIRNLQKGFFRPNNLTPHETYAARRAAIQMLATQFAAAGLLGLPFVSGALALLDKAFPDLELNRKTREGVNSFLSSDEENGSSLTDIAMTGVPSMFGWDMQSRLSMGNTLPGVSEVNGFQPENLLGPTANLVRNFTNGVTGFAKGDPKSAGSFLPPPVRKLIEAGQAALSSDPATSGIRDYQGRPLANPTRGEYAGALLGFQPKRLSDQNAAARMLKQSEEVLRTQESRSRTQWAEEVLKGNFGTVRQELLARSQSEKGFDSVAAVQAIARAAEELTFPRDLRREGTTKGSPVRRELMGSYSEDVGKASEVQRLGFRKQIEQRLGLQGDNRQELKIALLMDGLRAQNPGATRLELKAAALEASRRALPRTLGLPQESQ